MHHRFPERDGIFWRFAIAVGADHEQHAAYLSQHARLTMGHVTHPRCDARPLQLRRQFMRQRLGGSGDGTVEDQNRIAVVGLVVPLSAHILVAVVCMAIGCGGVRFFHLDPRWLL